MGVGGGGGGEDLTKEAAAAGQETKGFVGGKYKTSAVGVSLNFSKGKGDYHGTLGGRMTA